MTDLPPSKKPHRAPRRRFGAGRYGETHPNAVTNWPDVELMRACYETGEFTIRQLAEKFELPWSTVRDVVTYLTWSRTPPANAKETRHEPPRHQPPKRRRARRKKR